MTEKLTWRRKTVVAILLLVARMVEEEDRWHADLKNLANHISVGMGEGK